MRPLASSLFISLALVACTVDRSAIGSATAGEIAKAKGREFSAAVVRASSSGWAAQEVEHLVGLYTDDAILFPPKGDPIKGRDAIRNYWTRASNRKLLEHSIETERSDASGDLLVEHGRFSLISQSGENPPEPGSANFISVWKRGSDESGGNTWIVGGDLSLINRP